MEIDHSLGKKVENEKAIDVEKKVVRNGGGQKGSRKIKL